MNASLEYSVPAWKGHLSLVLMVPLPSSNPKLDLALNSPNTES